MSYRSAKRDTPEIFEADNPAERPGPCRQCSASATFKTRCDFGGLCAGCFRSYCDQPVTPAPYNQTTAGPRAWAYALKAREADGDRLSPVQKSAWRDALKGWA